MNVQSSSISRSVDCLWPPVHELLLLFVDVELLMACTPWIIFKILTSLSESIESFKDAYKIELNFCKQITIFFIFLWLDWCKFEGLCHVIVLDNFQLLAAELMQCHY